MCGHGQVVRGSAAVVQQLATSAATVGFATHLHTVRAKLRYYTVFYAAQSAWQSKPDKATSKSVWQSVHQESLTTLQQLV